ncbi:MAG: hypothetical protein BWY63_00464 [Chloroflexi bacterium ADurb.Bin360]|nr:MAG: hypothetical protein BWY63_00464 [Chloroflexi bacterium ADurb.Bin360]
MESCSGNIIAIIADADAAFHQRGDNVIQSFYIFFGFWKYAQNVLVCNMSMLISQRHEVVFTCFYLELAGFQIGFARLCILESHAV